MNGSYLMNPFLNNNTTITAAEVSIIRNSPLVKSSGDIFWIDINPVLIVAKATQQIPVPEPTIIMLFLFSFGVLLKITIHREK